jgi:hypothetical protein
VEDLRLWTRDSRTKIAEETHRTGAAACRPPGASSVNSHPL